MKKSFCSLIFLALTVFIFTTILAACSSSDDDDSGGATSDDTAGADDSGADDDAQPQIVPTTLDVTLAPVKNPVSGEWELKEAPGEPHRLRNDLNVQPAREAKSGDRLSLAYFMTISDLHQVDEESPTRLTFFDSSDILAGAFEAAFRPQEDLAPHLLNSLVRTANRIQVDYSRDFDFALSLGDNTDNGQTNEFQQLIDVLDGNGVISGKPGWARVDSGDLDIDPDTGLDRGERNFGVQEYNDDGDNIDFFQREGYPNSNADIPTDGLLNSSGDPVPWFTTIGNHDVLNTGNFDPTSGLTFYSLDDYLGEKAPYGFIPGLGTIIQQWRDDPSTPIYIDGGIFGLNIEWGFLFGILQPLGLIPDDISGEIDPRFNLAVLQNNTPLDTADDGIYVAPDQNRAFMTHDGFITTANGQGHGFADNNGDSVVNAQDGGWYRVDFDQVRPGSEMPLRLLVLDSSESPLLAEGGMTNTQLNWLRDRLEEAVADEVLVVVATHHSESNTIAGGSALSDILMACPNVILHLMGHGHDNLVTAHPAEAASGLNGYWEVETPSGIELPQQSRIVEIVDNRDGTGSIFLTGYDHWSMVGDDADILSELGRQLAFTDAMDKGWPGYGELGGEGTVNDRNAELLFAMPSAVADKLSGIDSDEPVTSDEVLGHLYEAK